MAGDARRLKASTVAGIAQMLLTRHREILEGSPALAWLLPRIEAALGPLLEALRRGTHEAVTEQSQSYLRHLDIERHDPVVRVLHYGLMATEVAAGLTSGGEGPAAQEVRDVRRIILPNGLSQTRKAWEIEAQEGQSNVDSLLPAQLRVLDRFSIGERKGSEWVREYRDICVEMQGVFDRRASARAQSETEINIREARSALLREILLLLDILPKSGLSEAEQAPIRGHFDDAVAAAARRVKAVSPSAVEEEEVSTAASEAEAAESEPAELDSPLPPSDD